WLCCTTRIR
ncbi:hypothetical protein BN1708_012600, partial [Verticillium longisporum]